MTPEAMSAGPSAATARLHFDGLMSALQSVQAFAGQQHSGGRGTPRGPASVALLSQVDTDRLYRTSALARRIVDKLPNECTRRGWTVRSSEVERGSDPTPFAAELRRLGLRATLNEADRLARKDGGAAVYMSIRDGRQPVKPVDWGNVKAVEFLRVIERWELTPATWHGDTRSADFGRPETYQYSPQTQGAAQGTEAMLHIHADRLLIMRGAVLPRRIRDAQEGWDDSVLEATWRTLQDFTQAERDIGQAIRSFSVAAFGMDDLKAIVSGPQADALMQRMLAINMGLDLTGLIVHDKTHEAVQFVSRSVAGMPELYDRLAQSLAACAEMSVTQLFGQAPGGLSTDDAAGRTYWYDLVADRQRNIYEPHIGRVVELLEVATMGPTRGQEITGGWSVEFTPLHEPTEAEKASTQKTRAETAAILGQWGGLDAEDVKRAVADSQGLLTDITPIVDDDEPDVEAEAEALESYAEDLARIDAEA